MPWPFAAVASPNFDSGVVQLPTSLTNVPNSTAVTTYLAKMLVSNNKDESVQVTLTDASGNVVVDSFEVPARDFKVLDFDGSPYAGIFQWKASLASALTAKLWGWT